MTTYDQTAQEVPVTGGRAFLRGFFIRLAQGSLALPVLALVRPELFQEQGRILLMAVTFYLLVCVAGGIYDVTTRQTRTTRLFQKPRMIDVAILVTIVIILWLTR